MTKKDPKPIFAEPYGGREGKHSFCQSWRIGKPIVCELCGTEWPASSDGLVWGMIFGRQFVEVCCGKLLDDLFDAFAARFTEAFLEDFSEDPTDSKFNSLRRILKDILTKAHSKTEEVLAEIKSAQEKLKQ